MTGARRAIVLGGTGHFGSAVVRELVGRGYRVTAAARRPTPELFAGLGVQVVCGDVNQPGQLNEWVAHEDFVVDAAAPHPLSLCVPDSPEERDPMGCAEHHVRLLLDAVSRGGAQLAFVSSFTTLPRPENGLRAVEAQWRRRTYPYFRAKQLMEDMVLDAARCGVKAVVVNPSAFLGPWDNKPEESSFVRLILAQRLPSTIHHVVNVIDVRDAAAVLCAAVDAGRYATPIQLSGHNIAFDELGRRIAALGGVQPPAFTTGVRATAVAAFWSEIALAAVGRVAPSSLRAVPLVADGWAMQTSAEQRALGVPIRPLEQTLCDTVNWHLGRFVA